MNSYPTHSEALAAARHHWRGADSDLIQPHPSGFGFTFDTHALYALRDIESDHQQTETMTEQTTQIEPNAAETGPTMTKREFQRVAREAKAHALGVSKAQKQQAKMEAKEKLEAERKAKADAKAVERATKRAEADAERETKLAARLKAREERRAASIQRHLAATARAQQQVSDREAAEQRRAYAASERLRLRDEAAAARKANSQNGVHKPNEGTKLANLWGLIDGMRVPDGSMPTFRDYKAVADTIPYETVGSPGTITTAFYDYRVYHGIKDESRAKASAE